MDSLRNCEANQEMNRENDHQMEVDGIVHDFVYREICRDKHFCFEDTGLLPHLHFHHLFDILMLDLDELHKIVLQTPD